MPMKDTRFKPDAFDIAKDIVLQRNPIPNSLTDILKIVWIKGRGLMVVNANYKNGSIK